MGRRTLWMWLLPCSFVAAAGDNSQLVQELLATHGRLEQEQARVRALIETLQPEAAELYGLQPVSERGVTSKLEPERARRLIDEDEIEAVEAQIGGLPDGPVKGALQHLVNAMANIRTVLDYLWLLVCGAMIAFMQAGFAMLEAGTCRSSSAGLTLLKNLMDSCAGASLWYAFSYAFAYGAPDNPNEFIGSNHVFAHNIDEGQRLDWFFQFTFCATSATIVSGAVAERIQFTGYLICASFMTALIYPAVVWWTWSGYGFLSEMGYSDFAGSGTVHLTGGSAAFAAAAILGPRLGRFDGDDSGRENPFVPHNLAMVVLGTFILWFGWYGFNCGSTLSFSSVETAQQAALVAMNSTLAAAAGGMTGLVVRGLETRKLDVLTCCNGILAGLVAVCAGCGDINPPSAVLIGVCGSLAMQAVSKAVAKLKVDDPLDACAVHGGGGLIGLLLRPLLDKTGVQGQMMGVHCLAGVCIIAWSMTLTAFMFLSLKKLGLLNVTHEEAKHGLDAAALIVGRDSGEDAHERHTDERSLKKEQCVIGKYVKVHESFMSNNKENKVMIKKGSYGKIVKVDNDGDVRVEFEKFGLQWVLRKNFEKLHGCEDPGSAESRKTMTMTTVNFAGLDGSPASTARAEVSMSTVSTARSKDLQGQTPAKKIVKKQGSAGSVVSFDDDRPPELTDEATSKARPSRVQKQKRPPMPMGMESGEHPAAGA